MKKEKKKKKEGKSMGSTTTAQKDFEKISIQFVQKEGNTTTFLFKKQTR